jgi:hypothetical protein
LRPEAEEGSGVRGLESGAAAEQGSENCPAPDARRKTPGPGGLKAVG